MFFCFSINGSIRFHSYPYYYKHIFSIRILLYAVKQEMIAVSALIAWHDLWTNPLLISWPENHRQWKSEGQVAACCPKDGSAKTMGP